MSEFWRRSKGREAERKLYYSLKKKSSRLKIKRGWELDSGRELNLFMG